MSLKKNLKKIILVLSRKNIIKLSDKKHLSFQYEIVFNKKMDLTKPISFNEKLQWLKLYDRNPEYTIMADKHEVKEYVSKKIGEKYIIPTIGVYNNFNEIDFKNLPNKFVLKPNHTSGDVFICNDKKDIDYIKLKKKIKKWLKRNYYLLHREWPYKNIKPKIIAEKYMVDESGEDLKDYKFFCFNGKVGTILVCSNRKGTFKNTDFYNTKWEKMPFTREKHTNNPEEIARPKNLEKMVEIAEKLSNEIPFVRIDLYEVNDKVYFGEFTFYPSAGFEGFEPEIWDYKLGNLMDIPNK